MSAPGEIPNDPLSLIVALVVVESDTDEGWVTDANSLFCEIVGWDRGQFGDARDPDILTDTLIGKPLDVLVPPRHRRAHKFFRQAFSAAPAPRTMGEGRDTPLFRRDAWASGVTGLERIVGSPVAVLIGLSAMDEHHTVAAVQPMQVGRQFALPAVK